MAKENDIGSPLDQLRKELERAHQRFLASLPESKRLELEEMERTEVPSFLRERERRLERYIRGRRRQP